MQGSPLGPVKTSVQRYQHSAAPPGLLIGVGSIDWLRHPLPPNRTCGSPASGSPVGGLTCERTDGPKDGRLLQAQRLPFGLLRRHPCCPVLRFALLSSASGHSPTLLAQRAMLSVSFRMDRTSRLHLPAPLRSPGITRLLRYYGCSDSCAEARFLGPFCSLRRAVPRSPFSSCAAQVSSLHVFCPSRAFRLQPPRCLP